MKTWGFLFLCFLVFTLSCLSFDHVVPQSEEDAKKNKFRDREATDDALGYPNFDEDELLNTQCPRHLEMRWQAEVSSSIYASPLIADINSDGKLEIVVPSFVHYLEVLEGSDGDKLPGWPVFHQSTVHSSPLLYDIDKDGVREIALATYNGEVLFFRASGYTMPDKLEIPRLKVKKDWHVGLNPDPADHSHPDVHDEELIRESLLDSLPVHNGNTLAANITNPTAPGQNDSSNSVPEHDTLNTTTSVQNDPTEGPSDSPNSTPEDTVKTTASVHSDLTAGPISAPEPDTLNTTTSVQNDSTAGHSDPPNSVPEHDTLNTTTTASANIQHNNNQLNASQEETRGENNESQLDATVKMTQNTNGSSSDYGSKNVSDGDIGKTSRRKLLEDKDSKGNEDVPAATVENNGGLEAEADSSFELFRDSDDLADDYRYDYDNTVDESMWGDEEWTEAQHEKLEDYVQIDAHVLCTPVIADIDNDGVFEMIVAVSYFFDREYYDNPDHLKELGGIDIGKYVAGGIVVFNLDTKQVKWGVQLDMSTDNSKFRAYIYSSPTVVDLDGDGNLDILVGTSFGLFYVLDHKGKVREKFPLEMAEIQGAVVAADINDDGKIELVTTDAHGNVAAWTPQGKEIWETHLKSLVPQGPSIGDVDGDGHTDIVVPTVSGNIYVLSGKDGSIVRPYPYRTHGRVMNQVLLVDLKKRGEKQKGLTIVTTSFDGYLYLIDGPTSCADVVDIGETSYSMVLADNVDGGDDLDLIVTTMNGNVFCFSTPSPHHPLKAWRSPNQGRNNAAHRYNRQGIYVTPSSRAFRDEEGKNFWVEVEIVDRNRFPSGSQAPYNVTVSLLVPGNYQGERTFKQNQIFDRPGKHRVKLPTVGVRTAGTVLVEMVDRNGLHFSDDFSLTFHMYYYKLLKWILVLPMLGMLGILVIQRPQEGMPLPSFSRNTDL